MKTAIVFEGEAGFMARSLSTPYVASFYGEARAGRLGPPTEQVGTSPMKRPTTYSHPPTDLGQLAAAARYVGSPEHKPGRWWGGQGSVGGAGGKLQRPKKQLTTACPLHTVKDKERATGWIREAIVAGRFLFVEGDKRFPRHVWHQDACGQGWIGRCINSVQGEYKGWPAGLHEIAALERRKAQGR